VFRFEWRGIETGDVTANLMASAMNVDDFDHELDGFVHHVDDFDRELDGLGHHGDDFDREVDGFGHHRDDFDREVDGFNREIGCIKIEMCDLDT
jgi:hypothetical protein